jgi:hypothetical protein
MQMVLPRPGWRGEAPVQRLAMLITPDGEWMLPDSAEFFEKLGDVHPDYDAEGFAVRNLGFIKFSIIERTIVEIELHPRNVALPALLAVQQRIQTAGVSLFRIKYLEATWQSEITSSPDQAMVRLSQLTAPSFVEPEGRRFVVEPRDYSELLTDDSNELRPMALKWRMLFGQFDSTVISFAISHHLLSRMLVVGIKPPGDPVWRFIGEAHSSWLDPRYHVSVIGDKIENIPDKDYGCWASQFYRNVAATGQPRFDCVTAEIRREANAYHSRYERLVLPWSTSSGEMLLTVCNKRLPDDSASGSPFADFDSFSARNLLKSA